MAKPLEVMKCPICESRIRYVSPENKVSATCVSEKCRRVYRRIYYFRVNKEVAKAKLRIKALKPNL